MVRVVLAAMLMIAAAAPLTAAAQPVSQPNSHAYDPAYDADFAALRVILGMLKESVSTMKDLDELQQIGMPESEVKQMREALLLKIEAMKFDALQTIRNL